MNKTPVCNYIQQEHRSRYIKDCKPAYDPNLYCDKYIEVGSKEAQERKERKNYYNESRLEKRYYDEPKATLDYTMFREIKIIKGVKL